MSERENSGFKLFGKDILKIPCYRETFLYSISSYIGVSLLTFLATSKPGFSSHVGFASFVIVTLGYYTKCRIQYADQKFKYGQMMQSLRKINAFEDIEKDKLSENKSNLEDA